MGWPGTVLRRSRGKNSQRRPGAIPRGPGAWRAAAAATSPRLGAGFGAGDPAIDEAGDLGRWDKAGDHVRGPQLMSESGSLFVILRVEHQHERLREPAAASGPGRSDPLRRLVSDQSGPPGKPGRSVPSRVRSPSGSRSSEPGAPGAGNEAEPTRCPSAREG